ncbi:MAG: SIS domain-containing protein [Phototrophicaceae bacterium]|jgi:D-sedoheptulose 7-phosphate isomerase
MADFSAYTQTFLQETIEIAQQIDPQSIVAATEILAHLRAEGGRLFILGNGGSAGNASHAVNDFRKITGIETYAPTDNVSELTAWINDVSFDAAFVEWLKVSRLSSRDALLVMSVGGGSATTSLNLVRAMEHAKAVGAKVISIVSRDGGKSKELSDACVLVPVVAKERITPHAESWQAVVWHLIVNALVAE